MMTSKTRRTLALLGIGRRPWVPLVDVTPRVLDACATLEHAAEQPERVLKPAPNRSWAFYESLSPSLLARRAARAVAEAKAQGKGRRYVWRDGAFELVDDADRAEGT